MKKLERNKNAKRNKKTKWKILKIAMIAIATLVLSLLVGFMLIRESGKASLADYGGDALPTLHLGSEEIIEAQTEEALKEGQILYEGKKYEYNEDILTFLALGVDSRQAILEEKIPGEGGQADTIMLVVLNPDTKAMKVIHVSRDTLTKVEIYDELGLYSHTEELQLALQYAYGEGTEKSCQLMETAVSNIFYGIPIHGYGAIDINAVGELNDAVGGVELTVIEDLSRFTPDLALGNTLTLTGRQALHYVQEREMDAEELGANNLRIDRQKQYLTAFVDKVITMLKTDITTGIDLYKIISEHMITSIGIDQVTYLSSLILDYSFTEEDMISVVGTMEKNGDYEEFIIDEEALYELIIQVFYQEVTE